MKRFLSLILCAAMMFSLIAVPVHGADFLEESSDAPHLYLQQRYYNFNKVTNPSSADNQRVLQTAYAQLGRTGSQLGYSEQWCSDFVCDVFHTAGISTSVIPWDFSGLAAVRFLCAKLEGMSNVREVSVKEAKPGDIVMFDWARTKYSGRSPASAMDHIALVEYYDPVEHILGWIGGNQGDAGNLYGRYVSEVARDMDNYPYVARVFRLSYGTSDPTPFNMPVNVTAVVSGPGSVSGGGSYIYGTQATLTATPWSTGMFQGWYDSTGKLLSSNLSYSFTAKEHVSVTAKFIALSELTVLASRSGTATGGGAYPPGSTVTLKAVANEGSTFLGWYNVWGTCLGTSTELSYTINAHTTIYAMFDGDRFVDVENAWYTDVIMAAAEAGYISGSGAFLFEPDRGITRAEFVTILAGLDGHTKADLLKCPPSTFTDIPGKWYEPFVNWAYGEGIVAGRSAEQFAPEDPISREEAAAIFVRYLESRGVSIDKDAPNFLDGEEISNWARDSVGQAQLAGIISGYAAEGGYLFKPMAGITRAEAVMMMMKTEALRDAARDEEPEDPEDPAEPEDPEGTEDPEGAGEPEVPAEAADEISADPEAPEAP